MPKVNIIKNITNKSFIKLCPCSSKKDYLSCCEPFITGKKIPNTPEELMRSRYLAYTMADLNYIKNTMRGEALALFKEHEAKLWAKRVVWIRLNVINSIMQNATLAYVEFEAIFVDGNYLKSIHENSEFILDNNRWYYTKGTHLPNIHNEKIISRTKPCPCGSLRKFKNCHGA